MGQFTGLLGVVVMVLLGLGLSYDRRHVRWKLVGVGILVQVVLAGTILACVSGSGQAFAYTSATSSIT